MIEKIFTSIGITILTLSITLTMWLGISPTDNYSVFGVFVITSFIFSILSYFVIQFKILRNYRVLNNTYGIYFLSIFPIINYVMMAILSIALIFHFDEFKKDILNEKEV